MEAMRQSYLKARRLKAKVLRLIKLASKELEREGMNGSSKGLEQVEDWVRKH